MTEIQLAKRTALKGHMALINKSIIENIRFFTEPGQIIPIKTILDKTRQQGDYANALMFLESLGNQIFRENWPDAPVLGMNGSRVTSEEQP